MCCCKAAAKGDCSCERHEKAVFWNLLLYFQVMDSDGATPSDVTPSASPGVVQDLHRQLAQTQKDLGDSQSERHRLASELLQVQAQWRMPALLMVSKLLALSIAFDNLSNFWQYQ